MQTLDTTHNSINAITCQLAHMSTLSVELLLAGLTGTVQWACKADEAVLDDPAAPADSVTAPAPMDAPKALTQGWKIDTADLVRIINFPLLFVKAVLASGDFARALRIRALESSGAGCIE
jgi:hypothetical protein